MSLELEPDVVKKMDVKDGANILEMNNLVIRVQYLALGLIKKDFSYDFYQKVWDKCYSNQGLAQRIREIIEGKLQGKNGKLVEVSDAELAGLARKIYRDIFKPIIDEELWHGGKSNAGKICHVRYE